MEPQSSILDPKLFIKQQSSLEDYQCSICYDLPAKPVRCKICRKPFCMTCVSEQKKVKDRCPFRCSDNPFSIQLITTIKIYFRCPYSLNCKAEIASLDAFTQHDLHCKEITHHDRQLKKHMREYKCLKGQHVLEFFVGTYEEMCNQLLCSYCKRKKLCRSICRPCNERFCVQCRPVPASKKFCPIGHSIVKRTLSDIDFVCDICGFPTVLMGFHIYYDYQCDYGICQLCYQSLPDLKPPIDCIQNNPQFCFLPHHKMANPEQHRLVIHQSESKKKCSNCRGLKNCPQTCVTCKSAYCLECKTLLISRNNLCPKDHELKKCENSNKIACHRCDKQEQEVMIDTECGIYLCLECVDYGKSIKSARERYLQPYFCANNHLLAYNNTYANLQRFCAKCGNHRLVKFFCTSCPKDNIFCAQCFPPPKLNHCYFDHKLEQLNPQKPPPKHCHYCSCKWHEKAAKFVGCYKCLLFFCQQCNEQIQNDIAKKVGMQELNFSL